MPPLEPDITDSGGRRGLVLPLVFVVLSVLLMVLPAPAQRQLSVLLRGSVLAPFLQLQESIQQARIRSGDIGTLQAELDSALSVLHSQSALAEENARLRALLDLRARGGAGFVPATAIRPGTQGSESMFLLDVGSRDGVEANQPVVVADGLIGVVREVGPRSASAMDWTHPDFRVSVMTLDGEVFGIVEPRRGIFREEDRLMLDGVPYHASVEPGVPVVTSGQGSVYPRGILVGTIDSLAETEAGWRRSYWLEPAVRPGSATHVLVFTGGVTLPADSLTTLWLPGEAGPGVRDTAVGDAASGSVDADTAMDDPEGDAEPEPDGGIEVPGSPDRGLEAPGGPDGQAPVVEDGGGQPDPAPAPSPDSADGDP